ncbi:MAG: corrinoid protein [candidate division NC10 bacterium]|nr:corrinoid protein [candidate division NC10 bacterium]
MGSFEEIARALIVGNHVRVRELTEIALKEGTDPQEIIYKGLIPGINVVGEKFRNNEYYVPQVLLAARAMYAGMDLVRPLIAKLGARYLGRVVIGTAQGDLHDIGKNLVAMMLEGTGFEVINLGSDVSPERFTEEARDKKAQIVGISALMTTTMPGMARTVEALKAAGIRDQVKVMIGGAPVTQLYADEIGADGYARDATAAVAKAKELLSLV